LSSAIHLVDFLDASLIEAPDRRHVELQSIVLGLRGETAIFQHPPSIIRFPLMKIPESGATLSFACGIKETAWIRLSAPITFEIAVSGSDGRTAPVFSLCLEPATTAEECRWRDAQIDLNAWAGTEIRIEFRTIASGSGVEYGWSVWADPVLEFLMNSDGLLGRAAPPIPKSRRPGPSILLVTCDALRRDHLGCYGGTKVKTPNLDRLAREGVLFKNARAQSDATLASHVSLLTSRLPHETRVVSEWGSYPGHLPDWATVCAGEGLTTLLAPSEWEFSEAGMGVHFGTVIPCLGVPAQTSEVTRRRFVRHMESAGDDPFFAWVQFFEPHPPLMPQQFFLGAMGRELPDPAISRGEEVVRGIHGIETSLELDSVFADLDAGITPFGFLSRLEETVRSLRGESRSGPDLAHHLKALPDAARLGLPLFQFAQWLEDQIAGWRGQSGKVPAALLSWLREIRETMRGAERDLSPWLDQVRNIDYCEFLYAASVKSVDIQLGQLMDWLARSGRLDTTWIVFTAPHGEMLGVPGMTFEHHLPLEEVLNVPLIIRPPDSCRWRRGLRWEPTTDLLDVAPTVLDAAGFNTPGSFRGRKLGRFLTEEEEPARHLSIAHSMQGRFAVIQDLDKKLVRCEFGAGDHWPPAKKITGKGACLLIGEHGTFDETTDRSADFPDEANQLGESLSVLIPSGAGVSPPLSPAGFRPMIAESGDGGDRSTAVDWLRVKEHSLLLKQAQRLTKGMIRTQNRVGQLATALAALRSEIDRLYASRRWRFANAFRLARRKAVTYDPIEKMFSRLASRLEEMDELLLKMRTQSVVIPGARDEKDQYQSWLDFRFDARQRRDPQVRLGSDPAIRFGVVVHSECSDSRVEALTKTIASVELSDWGDFVGWFAGEGDVGAGSLPERWSEGVPEPGSGREQDVTHWIFLRSGDEVEKDALRELAASLYLSRAEFVYADEDVVLEAGGYEDPYLKPDWSPELLESIPYPGRAAAFSRALVGASGKSIPDLTWRDAYHLALLCLERRSQVAHVREVLFHLSSVTGMDEKVGAALNRDALFDSLRRRDDPAEVSTTNYSNVFRVHRPIIRAEKVVIVIPTRDRVTLLRNCIRSIDANTAYPNFEIIVVDNDSKEEATHRYFEACGKRILRVPGPFNYSALNNAGAEASDAPWILFLNNDTEMRDPGWLDAILEQGQRPEIGVVGARLLYPEGTIQHSGVVLNIQGRPAHGFAHRSPDDPVSRGALAGTRNYSAVTGACLFTRRSVFEEVGGFDEAELPVSFNDTDYCMKARNLGYRIVVTPYPLILHHESASRVHRDSPGEVLVIEDRIRSLLGGGSDPYYHPLLDHQAASFTIRYDARA
jgi:GT2 family glycosyltransferase